MITTGLLPGFKLKRTIGPNPNFQTKSIKWLNHNKNTIRPGDTYNTLFQTTNFYATRDEEIDAATIQTLGRYFTIPED
ncbi:unnamed protein product [Acanthoscelides obtectus]|uniref:Uncharacterized protein n=1 Tax=Acanthoscelides obtectus TaxID=200917 RepID=A0A9P0M7G8_ACAOB|nr:unnamed protein product [Acanthoscelides obtectus]CAK1623147.1 hypothetical protein AOBTE_LOCUS1831 [Acanthoscelides obtectus]